jgi:hypothetical protein
MPTGDAGHDSVEGMTTTLVHYRRRPSEKERNVTVDLDPVRCGREL